MAISERDTFQMVGLIQLVKIHLLKNALWDKNITPSTGEKAGGPLLQISKSYLPFTPIVPYEYAIIIVAIRYPSFNTLN